MDVFVSTVDPKKEPSLVTANTILSVLSTDHPVEKLARYISDDGGALLIFEVVAEAARFAKCGFHFAESMISSQGNSKTYFNMTRDL